jgi:hypothetical protein
MDVCVALGRTSLTRTLSVCVSARHVHTLACIDHPDWINTIYPRRCYVLLNTMATFEASSDQCRLAGGDLVGIETATEFYRIIGKCAV